MVADSEQGRLGCHIKGEINAGSKNEAALSARWVPCNDVLPVDMEP